MSPCHGEDLARWVLGVTGGIPLPRDPDDGLAAVSASYRLFDDQADLMQALLLSELGRGVRSKLTQRRPSGIARALSGPVSHLPAEQR